MSKQHINLLPRATESDLRKEALKKRAVAISLWILGIAVVLVGGFYGWYWFTNLTLHNAQQQNTTLVQDLRKLSGTESILKGIEVKLEAYKELVRLYPKYPAFFSTLIEDAAPLVTLASATVDKEGMMDITVESPSRSNVDQFLKKFQDFSIKNSLKNVKINELNVEPGKRYEIRLRYEWSGV